MIFQKPRGTNDILPNDSLIWQNIRTYFQHLCDLFNFHEINTPIFEMANLYNRNLGSKSEIVSKEMFEFTDKKNRKYALRPEQTVGVVRAVIENKLLQKFCPQKFFYWGPMFRYDRPQRGRYRQFYQLGVEILDENSILNNIEIANFIHLFFQWLGLKKWTFKINFIGMASTREKFNNYLQTELLKTKIDLCSSCFKKIKTNPLKIYDCKIDAQKDILKKLSSIDSFFTKEEKQKFDKICFLLDNLRIKYEIDNRLVRGLDYYDDFVFEVNSTIEGFENIQLAGGGRYNGLIKSLGGEQKHSGVGFALGIERLVEQIKLEKIFEIPAKRNKLLLVAMDEFGLPIANLLCTALRKNNIKALLTDKYLTIKKGYKLAEEIQAENICFLGKKDLQEGHIMIKSFKNRKTHTFEFKNIEKIIELFKNE